MSLNTFVHSINIVGTLYFMSRNVDFVKNNSLKSDIFFNPIYIPCFPGSIFFRVHVFHGSGPGFRSSLIKSHFKKIQAQIQVCKESNILVYIIIILVIYFSLNKF